MASQFAQNELVVLATHGRSGYADLGDSRKTYPVVLTEPEINSIYAAVGFFNGFFGRLAPDSLWWNHYGPTLDTLSERLREFDDGNAPLA